MKDFIKLNFVCVFCVVCASVCEFLPVYRRRRMNEWPPFSKKEDTLLKSASVVCVGVWRGLKDAKLEFKTKANLNFKQTKKKRFLKFKKKT